MADISIQFHALPEELLPFVKQFIGEFQLHMVAMRFFPFDAIEVPSDGLDELFTDSSPYKELAFTLGKPALPVAHELNFGDKNHGSLYLHIGERNEKGLEQSWLTARTDNAEALSVWKKIAKRLKGMTQQGVTAINSKTGATAPMRSFRYTTGAKLLESSGVPMYPQGGGPLLRLGLIVEAELPNE